MGQNGIYIIYALIFMTVLLVVEGLYFLVSTTTQNEEAANKRMKLINKTGDDHIGITLLQNRANKNQNTGSDSFVEKIQKLLWAANSKLTVSGFFMLTGGIMIALFVIQFFLFQNGLILGLLTAIPFGFGVPYMVIKFKASKQQKLFSEQLVPAIDLVSRGLQAGHPAAVALEMVSKEMPDPIGTEFGLAMDEINYGQDRNVALGNIAQRFPNPDLRFFNSALEVQRETGGNLVEVLNSLSDVIRTRRAMRKKIWALSAEGRFSALIVGALPFVMVLVISLLNPGYYTEYASDPIQMIGLCIPVVLYVIGMYWIWKMIHIEI
jgi:tight adherence protein B